MNLQAQMLSAFCAWTLLTRIAPNICIALEILTVLGLGHFDLCPLAPSQSRRASTETPSPTKSQSKHVYLSRFCSSKAPGLALSGLLTTASHQNLPVLN